MAFAQRIAASTRAANIFISNSRNRLTRTVLPINNINQQRAKHYLAASAKDFEDRLATHDGKLVIVDFYADWCGPCRMLSPVLEKTTSDTQYSNGKEVDLMTIDTDEEGALAQKYGVTSLPTVIAFRDGKALDQFIGASPPPVVQKWIQRLTS